MIRSFSAILLLAFAPLTAQETLNDQLESCYQEWRQAMTTGDLVAWKRLTAAHRQREVRNRIVSEKRAFPAALFDLPAPPPALEEFSQLTTLRNGPTAANYYLGVLNAEPGSEDVLLAIHFIGSAGKWQYDRMKMILLREQPGLKQRLEAGDFAALQQLEELRPSGRIPPVAAAVPEPTCIAKVYVFCPGREVRVQVNQRSQHHFVNDKSAELILGGARSGDNEIQFVISDLPNADSNGPLVIRVYLLSQVPGVKPVKIFEHLVSEGHAVRPFEKGRFVLDARTERQLAGGIRNE